MRDHFVLRNYRLIKDVPRINQTLRLSYAFSKFYEEVYCQKKDRNYGIKKFLRMDSPLLVVTPELIK